MRFVLGGDGTISEKDRQELAQRQERIRRDADPLVLKRISRWEDHGMLPSRKSTAPPPPLPMAIRPQPTHFDRLADWYCGYLGVRDDYEVSYETQQDLKHAVPQAILRDIYRPVKNITREWERHDFELDPGGRQAMAEAKKAQQRDPLTPLPSSLTVFAAEQRRRRRLRDTPWQAARPDSAPRRYSDQDHVHYTEVEADSAGDSAGDDDDE